MILDLDDLYQHLRSALLVEPAAAGPFKEEWAVPGPSTPAAVLVPIVQHPCGPTMLLTQRADHLRDHGGQICFPGGRVEAADRDTVETALREAEEEIGLAPDQVEVVGFLPEYRTGTGFAVTPVVGFIKPPFELLPAPFEVAEIFEVPLAFLLDPQNHKRHSVHYRGRLGSFYAMPYGERYIWGATAGMIRSLYERLHGQED